MNDKILEGSEVDKKYANGDGEFTLDVDSKGNVKVTNEFGHDLDGYGKVASSVSLQTNVFYIAEKIASKTQTTWDDAAIKALESILGLAPGTATQVAAPTNG